MIGNILILLVVIGLALLFGWLTYRAIRAKKLWVKIVGGLGAGLLTLLFVAIAFAGAKGIAATYFSGAPDAPDLTVAGTPEQIARGEYLVDIACVGCHSQVGADGNPTGQHPLSGGWNIAEAEGFGFMGDMIAENLTPGGKLAGYSDGELFRVLRYSIDQQGHELGMMSFLPYREMSNEDTEAIIAYLRSLPPVPTSGVTGDKMSFLGAVMSGAGLFGEAPPPAPAVVTAPPQGVNAEYGKYVATFGECLGCHGPDATGTPATSVSAAIPNPRPLISTLTLEQFAAMMRSGVKPDGQPFPETMPWQNASKMTDDDLAALYAYLTAPVEWRNQVRCTSVAPPNFPGPPPHWHKVMAEVYYVVEGKMTFCVGEQTLEVGPGGYAYVPPGTVHGFSNQTDAPAKFLGIATPAILEQYFYELMELVKNEPQWPPQDMGKLMALMAKYDTFAPTAV